MKKLDYRRGPLIALATTLGIAAVPTAAQAIEFDYSSTSVSGEVVFTGSGTTADLSFTAASSFEIIGTVDGTGSAIGYLGSFTGTWTMGPVTTVTPSLFLEEIAPISGAGVLTISDGLNDLTATLAWVEVSSLSGASFAAGLLSGSVTGVSYAGSDPDLLEFAGELGRIAYLNYSFSLPDKSLGDLVQVGINSTSFYGSLRATPVTPISDSGATLILLGLGLCGLAAANERLRRRDFEPLIDADLH